MARRRRSRGGKKSRILPILIIVASLVVLIGAGVAAVMLKRGVTQIDPTTLCPRDGATGTIAVLFDLTDPLTRAQASVIHTRIENMIERAEVGALLTVGIVSPDPGEWGAKIAICKPRSGENASEVYENPELIRRRYQEKFIQPLEATLDRLLTVAEADSSPILESMQALVADTPGFVDGDGPRTLVIASDLIQNSPAMSFYRGQDWTSFAKSRDASRIASTLAGTKVVLLVIPRPTAKLRRPAAVEDFWARYLDAQGIDAYDTVRIGDL